MTDLARSSKPGNEWTRGDLDAYNIHATPQDPATFSGTPVLPEPQVPAEILDTLEADDMADDEHARLIDLLDLALVPPVEPNEEDSEESVIVDFAVELFRVLGYVGRRRHARTRKESPLPICRETRHAKTDVCIVDRLRNRVLVLVQEDRPRGEQPEGTFADTEALLIVQSVAAFVYNNEIRRASGLPELQEKVYACFYCSA